MARPVLIGRRALAVAAFVLFPLLLFAADSEQTKCAPLQASQANLTTAQKLEQQSARSAFYRELARRYGRPLSCSLNLEAGNISVAYTFRHHAGLVATTNPSIEFSDQTLVLPGMSVEKATDLLKGAEKESYTPHGCGISWDKPDSDGPGAKAGTREVVYRGDTCNCQARLLYEKNSVVMLILRSSC